VYILCDDSAELASKLFLLTDNPAWSDTKVKGHFKGFKEVTAEVRAVFQAKRLADCATVNSLLLRIEARRASRNDFFHSTHLLDLNFHQPRGAEYSPCAFMPFVNFSAVLFRRQFSLELGR
jgi:hypothetical protein